MFIFTDMDELRADLVQRNKHDQSRLAALRQQLADFTLAKDKTDQTSRAIVAQMRKDGGTGALHTEMSRRAASCVEREFVVRATVGESAGWDSVRIEQEMAA